MRGLILRLAIASLTFIIGITAASLWALPQGHRQPETISAKKSQPVSSVGEKKRTYEHQVQASGYWNSHRACFGVFSSTDGMKFSSTNVYFGSSKRARRELQKRLRDAIEIVNRETVFDKNGKRVGERVVATFAPYEDSSVASAAVIWTDGPDFGYIDSSSLQNIIEYEKDHPRLMAVK